MDFESLFEQYIIEFLADNGNLSIKKTYKTILYKIKYLSYSINNTKRASHSELSKLKKDLHNVNGKNYLISTRDETPLGYDRILLSYEQKIIFANHYEILNNGLYQVLKKYYKGNSVFKSELSVLEALIEITIDSYSKDLKQYDFYLEHIEKAFQDKKMPLMERIDTSIELKNFLLQKLNEYEMFDFNSFQKETLNR